MTVSPLQLFSPKEIAGRGLSTPHQCPLCGRDGYEPVCGSFGLCQNNVVMCANGRIVVQRVMPTLTNAPGSIRVYHVCDIQVIEYSPKTDMNSVLPSIYTRDTIMFDRFLIAGFRYIETCGSSTRIVIQPKRFSEIVREPIAENFTCRVNNISVDHPNETVLVDVKH